MPYAKIIGLLCAQLTWAGAIGNLFAYFDIWLKGQGYRAISGQIVDATIIATPRQRNSDDETAAL